ncbi:hypothetical protein AV530_010014 [Patagioenas fasciata monilis]|uniref:Uncharacterized protein n=1 Tax=Patagioenas fasciata monilis TaxID=372326 RepID=A0A1V4KB36_PATFA|nr:hypothetical protein AV530_010014 [Patagioenas fasciata monilis]
MEVHGGAEIHLQPGEDHTPEQMGAQGRLQPHGKPVLEQGPGRTCDPMERSPGWSRFAGRTCDPMGNQGWSSLFLKDCTSLERTHTGPVHEELQPVGRTHAGEIHGGLSPMGETPCWSRGRV